MAINFSARRTGRGKLNRFTKSQRDTLIQVKELILRFQCNYGIILDCDNNKCPFKIQGVNPIHNWSEGCLHSKLAELLKEKEGEK